MRARARGDIASRTRIERREKAWHRQYDIDPVRSTSACRILGILIRIALRAARGGAVS